MQELGEGTPDQVLDEARQHVLNKASEVRALEEARALADDNGETITEETIIDLDGDPHADAVEAARETTEVEDSVPEVDEVLAEPEIELQNEDALSRLVREAMQRAVESARSSES